MQIGLISDIFEIAKELVADARIRRTPLHTGTVTLKGLASALGKLVKHPADIKISLDPRL